MSEMWDERQAEKIRRAWGTPQTDDSQRMLEHLQALKDDNDAMREALSTIAESHGTTGAAVKQIVEIAKDCLGSLRNGG